MFDLRYRRLSSDETNSNSTVVILFLFFGITIGIITWQILSRYAKTLPYPVVIFFLGILFSAVVDTHSPSTFKDSINMWVNINPDLVLYITLPPLIFGEAMNLNWRHVKGSILPGFLLAGPGVVFQVALLGIFAKLILPYHWSWGLCFAFATCVSATDTVAVLTLLKSVGASPKLTMIIVAESLMNDGATLVLLTLFCRLLEDIKFTAWSVISYLLYCIVTSCVLGFGIGIVTVYWLATANRKLSDVDPVIQILITIAVAYLSFYLAEEVLGISGVLTCCGAGLVLSWLAKPLFLDHVNLHNAWSIIEWNMDTLVFLLGGLIIGYRIIQRVSSIDWAYMVLLYVAVMIFRFIAVMLCFPWLSNKFHKCTIQEATFISWSGLRGSLSIVLALILERLDNKNAPDIETSRILFYVGGIAALSLLFNGVSATFLLNYLHLVDNKSVEQELINVQVKKQIRKKLQLSLQSLSENLSIKDIHEIQSSCSLLVSDISIPPMLARLDSASSAFDSFRESFSSLSSLQIQRIESISRLLSETNIDIDRKNIIQDLLEYIRAVFLEIVRLKYWDLINNDKIPRLSHSSQFLLYSIDVGLDNLQNPQGLQDWTSIRSHISRQPILIRFLQFLNSIQLLKRIHLIPRLLSKLEARRAKRFVYILTSFIEAHSHAQNLIHNYIGTSNDEDSENISQVVTPEERKVKEESIKCVEDARSILTRINPEIIRSIQINQISRTLLAKEISLVSEMMNEGLLGEKGAEILLDEIQHDLDKIDKARNELYAEEETLNIKKYREDSYFTVFMRSPAKLTAGKDNTINFISSKESSIYSPILRTDN